MSPFLPLKLWIREHPLMLRHYHIRQEKSWFKRRVVRPGDAAVVEGFPRSANTFASYAFRDSQPQGLRFGNHFHSSAQFVLAARYGIPAMLVLREPIGACQSFMMFTGNVSAAESLARYIAFHKPLLRLQDHFTVAPFEEVTSNFGASIARMNARFGTNFTLFDHTPENQKQVFDTIAADRAKREKMFGAAFKDPLRTTTPTAEKEARKAQLAAEFQTPAVTKLIDTAVTIYRTLLDSMS